MEYEVVLVRSENYQVWGSIEAPNLKEAEILAQLGQYTVKYRKLISCHFEEVETVEEAK